MYNKKTLKEQSNLMDIINNYRKMKKNKQVNIEHSTEIFQC